MATSLLPLSPGFLEENNSLQALKIVAMLLQTITYRVTPSQQHVCALVDWYVEDEDKDKYGKPVEVWRKTFLPGGPSRYLPVARIFSKFVVASTFEDKIV